MSAITELFQARLNRARRRDHGGCVVCDRAGDSGLRVDFEARSDGSVHTSFPCDRGFQGYDGLLHGGVISLLMDGAMTNCLFARGIAAVTGELTVRYRHPVPVGGPVEIEARLTKSRPPFHRLEAELSRKGEVLVRASGKFIER